MRVALVSVLLVSLLLPPTDGAATAEPKPASTAPNNRVSLLTAEQLMQILDETVDWYRTLGTQQQSATQPSDLLLFYANRQTADKVIGLAFQTARANAELLSSEASAAQPSGGGNRSPQALEQLQRVPPGPQRQVVDVG